MLESIISFSSLYWIPYFLNLFADLFKFFKCRLFNKNSRKSIENVCLQWDITETNNWIRLLFFDDKSLFLFSKPVPKQLFSLL